MYSCCEELFFLLYQQFLSLYWFATFLTFYDDFMVVIVLFMKYQIEYKTFILVMGV